MDGRLIWRFTTIIFVVLLTTASAETPREAKALALVKAGVKLYEAGELHRAREVFINARDLVPHKPVPYRWVGLVDYKLDRCADVITDFSAFLDRVSRDDPRIPEATQLREECRSRLARAAAPSPPTVATPSRTAPARLSLATAAPEPPRSRSALLASASPEPRPRRRWIWGAVGGGAAIVVTTIIVGVVVGTAHPAPKPDYVIEGN